ncbi:MAG: hypothetical protein HY550_12315 [Elusimicrobia bacterium]|nr:hypothetical protein [Elusimicrobiota bacterium]
MPLKKYLAAFDASSRLKTALALSLAAGLILLNLFLALPALGLKGVYAGSFLLAGLPLNTVSWGMPMYQLLGAAALNLGLPPASIFVLLHAGIYALVYSAGGLLGGYYAGLASLAASGLLEAGGGFPYDAEQSLYSFFLLLLLSLLLLKRRDPSPGTAALCGLAAGASLLVRTPLFLFPPFFALCGWPTGGDRSKAFLRRSLLFILASYALLVPWALLNRSVSGEFSFFDGRRGACNIITAAKGSIYTMEGDSRLLAGIGEEDSSVKFYVREILKDPVFHASTVLRRVWYILLFYPALFAALLLAAAASREKNKLPLFSLPLYFVLIHSFLSIEKRYFYPLLYLLPPLIAGSLFSRFSGRPAEESARPAKSVYFLSGLSFCAVLAVEALILAYPQRAARNSADHAAFSRAIGRFPRDRVFRELGCARLRERGDDEGFYRCLSDYGREFKDGAKEYFLLAVKSGKPSEIKNKGGEGLDGLVIRMLRELELGDRAAASVSLEEAFYEYNTHLNLLRKETNETDRKLAGLIRQNTSGFWERSVYPALLLWPPRGAARILAGLKERSGLTPRLRELDAELSLLDAHGEFGDRLARGRIFSEMFLNVLGLPPGLLRLIREEDSEKSKKLSDLAAEKMRAGDPAGAEELLSEAVAINAYNPEALMDICVLRLKKKMKAGALEACRSSSYAVYAFPENRLPGFRMLASEADLVSYKLLRSLGRGPEAALVLRECVKRAPADWPGLPGAKAELERY